jgi:fructuronate reductase
MVDSITPATDDALRARVETATGLSDAWPIQREAFTQWVVEDVLGADAPDLASVGVTLTDDVRGFERAKLRCSTACIPPWPMPAFCADTRPSSRR